MLPGGKRHQGLFGGRAFGCPGILAQSHMDDARTFERQTCMVLCCQQRALPQTDFAYQDFGGLYSCIWGAGGGGSLRAFFQAKAQLQALRSGFGAFGAAWRGFWVAAKRHHPAARRAL